MKLIVLTAPSGAGKTTIARRVQEVLPDVRFSVSATTRPPRTGEQHGVDYFFLSPEDFRTQIEVGALLEYEEVYPGRLYGTLRSEVERAAQAGPVLLDVDVKGAVNVKDLYGLDALTLFISPPSIDALAERLRTRGTETPTSLQTRLDRAEEELHYADRFDHVVVNDDLDQAVEETLAYVRAFLSV